MSIHIHEADEVCNMAMAVDEVDEVDEVLNMAMAVDEVDEVCNMAMAVDEVCNMAMAATCPTIPYVRRKCGKARQKKKLPEDY